MDDIRKEKVQPMNTFTRGAALGLAMFLLSALIGWSGGRQQDGFPVELDVEIRGRVEQWLENQDRFNDSEILVSVKDGEVTLQGEVPSYALKRRAELEASNVPGVASVQNRLQVALDETAGEKVLSEQVLTFLSLQPEVAREDIDVDAEAGVVTLSGTVDTVWKKQRAGQLASEVIGVMDVVNRILVVPTEQRRDTELAEQIAGALSRNSSVRLDAIDVQVSEGKVTLSGTVSSPEAREAAVETAQVMAGVTGVEDRLEVREPDIEPYTDEEIVAKVRDQLYWDSRVEEQRIEVQVEEGVVTLSGRVDSAVEMRAAVNDARRTPSVRFVENELLVDLPPASSADRILTAAVRSVLNLNQEIDASELAVTVRAGEAVLEGSVESLGEKLKAEELAGEVRGVVDVVDKIVVVPTEKILDQAIAEDIEARIDVDPNVRVEDVNVIVNQGRVTLSGIVLSPAARNAAEQAAVQTYGVTEVDNRIFVGD
jgi:osmotically-inducible protein OsmY